MVPFEMLASEANFFLASEKRGKVEKVKDNLNFHHNG